jgi:hypothetical protein
MPAIEMLTSDSAIDAEPTDQADPVTDSGPTDQVTDPGAESPDDDNPNHEAAKWRVKYREAEQHNAALTSQLDAVRRDQINAHVVAAGVKPDAFWASGVTVNDLVTEAGGIDATKVGEAVAGVRERFGIDKRSPSMSGLSSGAMNRPPPRDTFRDAFVPRSRRQPD